MAEDLTDSHKFNLWKNRLVSNGLDIHRVDELYTRRNGHGEVLFSLLYTDATTPEGNKIPPICFLKGEVVSVLVCFIDVVATPHLRRVDDLRTPGRYARQRKRRRFGSRARSV